MRLCKVKQKMEKKRENLEIYSFNVQPTKEPQNKHSEPVCA